MVSHLQNQKLHALLYVVPCKKKITFWEWDWSSPSVWK